MAQVLWDFVPDIFADGGHLALLMTPVQKSQFGIRGCCFGFLA